MRRLGSITLITVMVLAAAALYFAIVGSWILAFTGLVLIQILGLCTIFISLRYNVRLVRTETKKGRQYLVRNTKRLENILKTQEISTQRVLEETLSKAHADYSEQLKQIKREISSHARTNRSHTNQTVRHSVNEIEALIQLFSKFPDTRLPMPLSGGWAIDAYSLAYLLEHVAEKKPKLIVELGSGTSTVWLGYLCRSLGLKLVTVDHLEHYLEHTQLAVQRHGLSEYVECRLAPLDEFSLGEESYKWYRKSVLSDLENIEMLIVDGPPGSTGKNARFPALPLLEDQLSASASVVIDDAHRRDEEDVLEQWLSQYPEFERLIIGTSRLAIVSREDIPSEESTSY